MCIPCKLHTFEVVIKNKMPKSWFICHVREYILRYIVGQNDFHKFHAYGYVLTQFQFAYTCPYHFMIICRYTLFSSYSISIFFSPPFGLYHFNHFHAVFSLLTLLVIVSHTQLSRDGLSNRPQCCT